VGPSIFDTAVFNRSAGRPANQENLPISVQTETAKSQSFSVVPKAVRTESVKSPVRPTSSDQAQDLSELNELKAKIWEAEVAQRNFTAGLPHCSELNGTNFYFNPQNRVLNLQDYRRSLENLVAHGAFNQETRGSWNKQDAEARWAQVQKRAITDQANCAAVASLPSLRQKLKELQQRQ
jgi:tRNA nucleotidyltransferase/poly(A) polymerase